MSEVGGIDMAVSAASNTEPSPVAAALGVGPAVAAISAGQARGEFVVPYRSPWRLAVKRLTDVVVSLLGLVVLAPVFGVLALVVFLADGRPIFFRWDVLGEQARPFRGYKFRTMVIGADAQRLELASHNEMQGPVFKMRNDPRVTRIGAILRRYSLDELPQLWSVLKGDMSLVGPRPMSAGEYAQAMPYQRQKLSVIPGITCLWQVTGRSQISNFDSWVALDLQYIEQWSLLLDLKILLRTVPAVVGRRGAW